MDSYSRPFPQMSWLRFGSTVSSSDKFHEQSGARDDIQTPALHLSDNVIQETQIASCRYEADQHICNQSPELP